MTINTISNSVPTVPNTSSTRRTNTPNSINFNINGQGLTSLTQLIRLIQKLLANLQNPTQPNPNTTPSISINTQQKDNITELLGLGRNAPFTPVVKDMDGNGVISKGDVVITYGGFTGGEINRRTLSAADVKAINKTTSINVDTAPNLNLTQAQQVSLNKLMGGGAFSILVKDMDQSGTLTAGDIAISYGGATDGEEITRRTLSAADIQAINNPNKPVQELDANKTKWDSSAPKKNYDFTLKNNGFRIDGGRPINISVRDGSVVSAKYADTGATADANSYKTIDGLFKVISDAFAENAAQVNVKYDSSTGAPSSIFIDYNSMMADEEAAYEISNVKILS